MALRARLGAFLADESGTSVIELAIVTPVLLVMLLGMIDGAMGVSTKLKLQQAAARSIELVSAGGLASVSGVSAEAVAASGQSAANVTVDSWLECNGVRQASIDGTCPASQQIGRFASVTITGTYVPMMSGAMQTFGLPGTVTLTGKSSVRVQ